MLKLWSYFDAALPSNECSLKSKTQRLDTPV